MIELLLAVWLGGAFWTWGDYKYGKGVTDCSDVYHFVIEATCPQVQFSIDSK